MTENDDLSGAEMIDQRKYVVGQGNDTEPPVGWDSGRQVAP
nr:hypothetical protein [Salipiger thiooxidans]